jgi:H+/Cl- antiporter ClcA
MIRFLKEVYLTGFAIIFKISREKDVGFRIGIAIGPVAFVESLFLIGISDCIQMFLNKRILFSNSQAAIAFFILFFVNMYFLWLRGYGVKFADKFDGLKKSRRILLVTSCAVILVATIIFLIYSAIAYRHFFGIK